MTFGAAERRADGWVIPLDVLTPHSALSIERYKCEVDKRRITLRVRTVFVGYSGQGLAPVPEGITLPAECTGVYEIYYRDTDGDLYMTTIDLDHPTEIIWTTR